jgi:hypothetical protein
LSPHCPIWFLIMDIVHLCLSLTPVPCLAPAFSALRFIWSSIERAKASKCQLEALAQSIAQLLKALDGEYRNGRLLKARTSTPLADLHKLVKFITLFIVIYSSTPQAPGRNIGFCAEGSIVRISETTLYQGSTNCSDRYLLPTHCHLDRIVSGKLFCL